MRIATLLLILSGLLVALMVFLMGLGDRTLPMFGGDRVSAARTMNSLFGLLGGVAFACAQPAIWLGLGRTRRFRWNKQATAGSPEGSPGELEE